MTSTSFGHTNKVLLVIFAAFYALLVVWCKFGQVSEEEAMAEYHDGGFSGASEERFHLPFSQSAPKPITAPSIRHGRFGASYHRYAGYTYPLHDAINNTLSSNYPTANGVYTTSSAQVQSYGGWEAGRTLRTGPNQSSHTDTYPQAIRPLLSLTHSSESVYASVATENTSTKEAQQAAIQSAMAHRSSSWGGMHTITNHSIERPYTADQRLAYANHHSMRKIGGGSVEDAWVRWFEKLYGEETLLTIDQLKSLYAQLTDNGDYPSLTWEEFLSWFNQKQGNEDFQWTLPVGDGAGTLVVLALLYLLYKVVRTACPKQNA